MEKEMLSCTVITPMFSFGNNRGDPELRASELKGLIRYIFRITQQTMNIEKLFETECAIFGNSEKHASPICLQLRSDFKPENSKKGLLCNKKDNPIKIPAIPIDEKFKIIIRKRNIKPDQSQMGMCWYINLIRLSLLLGGMGRRSRRARGCVSVEPEFNDVKAAKTFIYNTLNEIMICENTSDSYYTIENEYIVYKGKIKDLKRPIIEKIILGKKIKVRNKKDNTKKDIEDFLKDIDKASNKIKLKNKGSFATGNCYGSNRLSSPVIVSLIKTKEGYFPVYTYVKAVYHGNQIDKDQNERSEFVQKIEEGI